MRQNNKYLEKVYDEMDIYQQHMLGERQLTVQQKETFEKIDIIRGWLREGFSDIQAITLAKSDPRVNVQDRRARELIAMAYQVFADLRQLRSRDGIKFMYAELLRNTAADVKKDYEALRDRGTDDKAAAALLREWKAMIKEAATIDGAYDTSKLPDDAKKKPTKIVIKRKTVIADSGKNYDELTEEAHYETVE